MRQRSVFVFVMAVLAAGTLPAAIIVAQSELTGTWTAEPSTSRRTSDDGQPGINLQLKSEGERGWSSHGQTVPRASLTGLPADLSRVTEARFELRRDAGTLRFEGQFRDGRGIGEFRFQPDASFAQYLASRGDDRTSRQMLSLAMLDVSRAFIQQTEQAFPGIALSDVVSFRIHGVTPEFRAEMAKRGFTGLTPRQLVTARIHGISPAYVDEMRKAGFADEGLDALVKLRIHGVSETFMREMASAGYENLSARELTEARIHGVSPAFARSVREAGYDVPLSGLKKMRIHRVTPEFITSLREAGYRDLSVNQLVEFRIHGVDAPFIEELKKDGYTGLSPRELVEIRIHARRWLPRRAR